MRTLPPFQQHLLSLTISALFASDALAQAEVSTTAPSVVITGTRVANRSALDTAAPVDIISADTLKQSGSTEINQALSIALPALNFPRPGLADGTDTVRPATLRGMAPDQTLVLVNGKRRHASSLVNVNATIGRGSAAVDMNTIPSAIVRNIEVLRDGAAAQYGSDAIAGVVNLRLRTDRSGGEAAVTYGARITEYNFNVDAAPSGATWPPQTSRKRTDGHTATVSLWKGLALGESGYLTIAAEVKDQHRTERSGYDMRQQYPRINGAFDPRENTINRFNAWYGEPELEQATLFANAGATLTGGAKVYGWASYQKRDARSAGFFRWANDPRNIIEIYPNGFLPIIAPSVDDYAATAGIEWTLGDWALDASLGYGKNKMDFTIENTLNRSIGPTSPTEFAAGGFSYDQLVLNLTGVRAFDVTGLASPLNVALGVEARREGFKQMAGEPDSYRHGGLRYPDGTFTPPGAQVFAGFRPSNETDSHRSAVGAFVDMEANVTEQLLLSGALRAEHYSDFGDSLAGKLAGRFDFSKSFALRGSIQNGFRAPSPQQQNFTSTATNFISGVPFEITTFKPTDPVAAALGAQPLEAEKSVNLSLGAVARFGAASLTIDAYRIKVRDRIVLSENLTQADVRNFLTSQGFIGVGGGRFFINGVDTTTDGVDVVLNWPYNAGAAGRFDFTLAASYTDTKVTRVPSTAQLSALPSAPPLFARVNTLTLEQGQPKDKVTASANWKRGALGATLRATRYGKVLSPNANALFDLMLSARTLVDVEGRFALTPKMTFALGAENLFDQYPDPVNPAINPSGNQPFPNYSPFGRAGRLVYARANYAF